jgi:hypothetical protein
MPLPMVLVRVDSTSTPLPVDGTKTCCGGRHPGALDHLTRDELRQGLAHEFENHIREGRPTP